MLHPMHPPRPVRRTNQHKPCRLLSCFYPVLLDADTPEAPDDLLTMLIRRYWSYGLSDAQMLMLIMKDFNPEEYGLR
jgi:hypothetical protein